jgi:hypothetical protein
VEAVGREKASMGKIHEVLKCGQVEQCQGASIEAVNCDLDGQGNVCMHCLLVTRSAVRFREVSYKRAELNKGIKHAERQLKHNLTITLPTGSKKLPHQQNLPSAKSSKSSRPLHSPTSSKTKFLLATKENPYQLVGVPGHLPSKTLQTLQTLSSSSSSPSSPSLSSSPESKSDRS